MSDSESEISFGTEAERVRTWAKTMKINDLAAEEILNQGFDTMEALSLIDAEDIQNFRIPVGQRKVISRALDKTFTRKSNMAADSGALGESEASGSGKQDGGSSGINNNGGAQGQSGSGVSASNITSNAVDDAYINEILKMMSAQKQHSNGQTNGVSDNMNSGSQLVPMEVRMLDSIVANFRSHTFAESTKKTYKNYLNSYMEFCKFLKIPLVPLTPDNLARYIAYLSRRLQVNSINNYLSVVRLLHLEAGVPSPLDSFLIQTVLRGAKRVLGCNTKSKLPITPAILHELFPLLTLHNSKDLCFWSACLVAFFSFLRKSNLFVPSAAQFDPMRHLCRDNIFFNCDGVRLKVHKTKTIQFSERTLEIPLPRISNSLLCPSKALLLAFKSVPAKTTPSPAFLYLAQGETIPLTYSVFLKMLKHYLALLGVDSNSYSRHSFRRGGASFALECGVPEYLIQSQGDWKSNAYKTYLNPSFAHRQQVVNRFSQILNK